jgi:hypothetical protein
VKLLALLLGALVALIPIRAAASGADFTAASANPGTSFATAADFNTVAVSLTDPGTNLRGTVTLSASAASDRGIAGVTFQTSPAGMNTWTTACTASTAPYSCAYDTTTTVDGPRDIRAVATDAAGYWRAATVGSRRIDNTAPATTLGDPGTPLTGTKTLTATATDGGSGLASVALQLRASGSSSWTTICAAASCNLSTATLADGSYDLRSLATDAAGNTSTSTVSARIVDNTAPTAKLNLPATVRGTFTLAATTGDGNGSGVASVLYQMRSTGTTTWSTACSSGTAPFSCTGDTSSVPDGTYDVRAIATDGAGYSTTTATGTTRLDNTAPTATLTDPGTPLSGTVNLSATAIDGGSGVASVTIAGAPAGTSTWTTICTDASSPYSCSWSTTSLIDGLYDLRAVATDVAGNNTTVTVTSRRVDNNGPTVAVTDPGSPIRNTISIGATASDPAGVASVAIQRKLSTGSAWTTLCTDSSSPYACPLTGLGDGTYDFRAQATDAVGHTSTSATLAARAVDDTPPTGTNIQAVNGTGTAGRVDAGDIVTFSLSEPMAPATILAGWSGASTAVNLRLTDGGGALDTLTIYDTSNSTKLNLGDVALKANRTAAGARFAATMTMSGSTVTVTVGGLISGATIASSSTTPMVWTPSSAATDLAGNAMSSAAVTETGTDVDF